MDVRRQRVDPGSPSLQACCAVEGLAGLGQAEDLIARIFPAPYARNSAGQPGVDPGQMIIREGRLTSRMSKNSISGAKE